MTSVPKLEVKNIGRWKSVIEFAKYMAVGAARRKKLEKDTGVDPIFSTWVCRRSYRPTMNNRGYVDLKKRPKTFI